MFAGKPMSIVVLMLALSACGGGEPASRNDAPPALTLAASGSANPRAAMTPVRLAPRYSVAEVRVEVPRTLRVSEANVFFPIADIVWREEPPGDRHAQVRAVFAEGLAAGVATMTGTDPARPAIIVTATVTRFHSLTQKTRYTVGGTHALNFVLTLRDAATGALMEPPRAIVADVPAAGGAAAIAEEQAGRTQRVVITERLAAVIRRELSVPAGAAPARFPGTTARTASTLRLTAARFAP